MAGIRSLSDAPDLSAASIFEDLDQPWVLGVLGVTLGVVLLLIPFVVCWARAWADRKAGPVGRAVNHVLRGHIQTERQCTAAAAASYRAALLELCAAALAPADNDSKDPELSAGSATPACKADEALQRYNSTVGLSVALAFALPSSASVADAPAADVTPPEDDRQPRPSGDDEAAPGEVYVCSRCGTHSRAETKGLYYRCFSCQATALTWKFFTGPPPHVEERAVQRCMRLRWRVRPEVSYLHLQSISWEDSGLESVVKHPTGFGKACVVPEACHHHTQVGATCGLAAFNNLVTNCDGQQMDADYMMDISKRMAQAETAIREGVECVEEAGEEQKVADLYSTSMGGHFDVQTLQIAFSEAGFNMWYEQAPKKLEDYNMLGSQGEEVAGYVVHRRDPLNLRQDHWFVVRPHNGDMLLQDSLFPEVFVLTKMEAHQLLLNLPSGSLFAVSKNARLPRAE